MFWILRLLVVFVLPLTVEAESEDLYSLAVFGNSKGEIVDDSVLVERVVKSYQNARHQHLGQSMWQIFFDQRHRNIHRVMMDGNLQRATQILRNPGSSELFYGFDNLCKSILLKYSKLGNREKSARKHLFNLVQFLKLIDPDFRGDVVSQAPYNSDNIIAQIEKKLGVELTLPNPYPNESGLQTSKGIISYRTIQALYQAWRIKQIVKDITNPSVVEIGAGLGRTVYFSRLLGIKDYTVVDIPFTTLSSGYFLGRTLGSQKILLSNEVTSRHKKFSKQVKILNPDVFFKNKRKYDLVVNFDSLTEMDIAVARDYVKKISKSSTYFLSVNHALNSFTVAQLISPVKRAKVLLRTNYPIRTGYAEELFGFKS